MTIMNLRSIFTLIAALSLSASFPAHAQSYKAGDISIDQAFARATVPHQPSGGAYLTIENHGKTADRLVSASSPVARSVEIHTMTMEGNIMKMREAGSLEIKPSERVVMQPGQGYHLMMMGLKEPLKAGGTFPVTLTFEKAGTLQLQVKVQDKALANGSSGGMPHSR